MDRIFSARITDKTFRQIHNLSRRLRTSKKAVVERAMDLLGSKIEEDQKTDVFDETRGIWKRKETPGITVSKIRKAFRDSMHRHAR